MKEVMIRAWKIAREAVERFGGKVKEYISQSLRMAWKEIKKGEKKMEERKNRAIEELVCKVEVRNGSLVNTLGGDTYYIKDEIKGLGYKWNADKRDWEKKFEASEFKAVVGQAISAFHLAGANLFATKEAQEIIKKAI